MSWIKQYEPKDTSEVAGQNKAVENLKQFITGFKKGKAVILYGPTGSGKTCSVNAIAKELNYELIEVNASDRRNKDQIESILGNAAKQASLFYTGKIILMDEVDGLSGQKDRGGLSAVAKIIGESSFPIVCTMTDPFDKKFTLLRKKCELIEFSTLSYISVANILKRIAKKENIKFNDEDMTTLARRSGGDLRAAINDLQTLTQNSKELKRKDIDELGERHQTEKMHSALMKVFKTTDLSVALGAFDNVSEDFDKCMLWLEENIPKEYEKADDLARAFDYLSKADVMKRRIRRRQHWRFLVYISAYLTGGIACAKDEKYKKFVKYMPTTRILKLWQAKMKYAKRKVIAEKIAEQTHCSTTTALQNTLPYLQAGMKRNKEFAAAMTEEFEFDKDEVTWLMK